MASVARGPLRHRHDRHGLGRHLSRGADDPAPCRAALRRRALVLLTGATGCIGCVADALVEGGHRVIGLARSAEAADRLQGRGIDPAFDDLDDAEGLAAICGRCNAVVHLAFGWKADVGFTT